jgi:hypothetical protein
LIWEIPIEYIMQGGRLDTQSEGAVPARAGIPYRLLGSTGEEVSIIGLGGAHVGMQESEAESIRMLSISEMGHFWNRTLWYSQAV